MLMPRKNNKTETLAVKKGRTGLGTSGSMLCPCATVRTIGEIGRGGGGSQKSPFWEASVFSPPRRLRSIAHCVPAQLIGRTRLFPKKKITHLCCISTGTRRLKAGEADPVVKGELHVCSSPAAAVVVRRGGGLEEGVQGDVGGGGDFATG